MESRGFILIISMTSSMACTNGDKFYFAISIAADPDPAI
jgi:hypothetical protein